MKVNELFDKIQEQLSPDELSGELQLQSDCIVWTYNLINDSEEIELPVDEDDDEPTFSFESESSEELLQEAYEDDLEIIEEILDELEESDNWSTSDPDTVGNIISFKIF